MPAPRRAFTLIELLVTIAVMALLTGILLPSLAGARQRARMLTELAAARQLILGYTGYAMEHKSELIPGHLSESVPLSDDAGQTLTPAEVAKRWPWRLAAHMNYAMRGSILVNEQAKALADRTQPLWAYYVSLTPSFGLNYFNLGGDLTGGGASNAPGMLRKLDQALRPTRMIVFASARSIGETGVVQGYFKIVPPTKPFEYSAKGWTADPFRESGDPAAWGYVHPRWDGRAVVANLDGSGATLGVAELRDMTRWSDPAAKAGDPEWRAR